MGAHHLRDRPQASAHHTSLGGNPFAAVLRSPTSKARRPLNAGASRAKPQGRGRKPWVSRCRPQAPRPSTSRATASSRAARSSRESAPSPSLPQWASVRASRLSARSHHRAKWPPTRLRARRACTLCAPSTARAAATCRAPCATASSCALSPATCLDARVMPTPACVQ